MHIVFHLSNLFLFTFIDNKIFCYILAIYMSQRICLSLFYTIFLTNIIDALRIFRGLFCKLFDIIICSACMERKCFIDIVFQFVIGLCLSYTILLSRGVVMIGPISCSNRPTCYGHNNGPIFLFLNSIIQCFFDDLRFISFRYAQIKYEFLVEMYFYY